MTDRKERIEELVAATLAHYTRLGGGDPADAQTTLVDLLADLMLTSAGNADVNFDAALDSARLHVAFEDDSEPTFEDMPEDDYGPEAYDDDSHLAQFDDDPNPYHGTYSEE